jgi:SHS2 domain-containing protein
MSHQYRVLDDVALADAAFEATGDSPSELFLAAAQAVIETMVDPTTVAPSWQRAFERQGADLPSLLFDWLSDIVYLKDAEGVVFREATAEVTQTDAAGWRLCGKLAGEPIDQTRHVLRSDVKAVTKHLYDVRHENGHWFARVVLDI